MATVKIQVNKHVLEGSLTVPSGARALVIFSHGSGSSRFSPRNNFVAEHLNKNRIATLLIDLLTEAEDAVYMNRFNIRLLADRLNAVTRWVLDHLGEKHLPIGFFGASTGAASALTVAAEMSETIEAIVSRGGRPDMALCNLSEVEAPTLLIVGANDEQVLELNQRAFDLLGSEKQLVTIAGATHLFEEAGALERVATLASNWFAKHLVAQRAKAPVKRILETLVKW